MGSFRPCSVVVGLLVGTALAPSALGYTIQHCTNLTKEGTSALLRQNWHQLLETSKDLEKECGGILDIESVATAISGQAQALVELSNGPHALLAADRCVKVFWPLPQCHYQRARALLLLGRNADARISLGTARVRALQSIDQAAAAVRGVRNELDRELWTAKRSNYRAILRAVEAHLRDIN
jgi:hypothetical protein